VERPAAWCYAALRRALRPPPLPGLALCDRSLIAVCREERLEGPRTDGQGRESRFLPFFVSAVSSDTTGLGDEATWACSACSIASLFFFLVIL
jgi:hypothetical protein